MPNADLTNGHASAQRFLACWNWEKWVHGDYAELLAAVATYGHGRAPQ